MAWLNDGLDAIFSSFTGPKMCCGSRQSCTGRGSNGYPGSQLLDLAAVHRHSAESAMEMKKARANAPQMRPSISCSPRHLAGNRGSLPPQRPIPRVSSAGIRGSTQLPQGFQRHSGRLASAPSAPGWRRRVVEEEPSSESGGSASATTSDDSEGSDEDDESSEDGAAPLMQRCTSQIVVSKAQSASSKLHAMQVEVKRKYSSVGLSRHDVVRRAWLALEEKDWALCEVRVNVQDSALEFWIIQGDVVQHKEESILWAHMLTVEHRQVKNTKKTDDICQITHSNPEEESDPEHILAIRCGDRETKNDFMESVQSLIFAVEQGVHTMLRKNSTKRTDAIGSVPRPRPPAQAPAFRGALNS
mmetsp:Transcript_43316/g.114189  ORF Transcript_43316/g.114189 Transcript_43316/m.114189 type:complete len:358 (+) Transcript_43316:72-1145(+)